ncbi:MAG: hypothetical protein R3D44_03230 [Hyphomicrobiaceae bacterium]
MSSLAGTLDGAVPGAGEGRVAQVWSALKSGLLGFLKRLPDRHQDVDLETFKRLPVPY